MLQQYLQKRSLKSDALNYKANEKEEDPFLVQWTEDDVRNPQQWSLGKKWFVTIQVALIALVVGYAGGVNSAADAQAAEKFGVSGEVMALQTGLFLVGFGVSAPAMGPLSELSGRLPTYLFPLIIFGVFCLGSGFATNIQTRVILRFFAGFFGAAPLSNAGGSVADMCGPLQRTYLFPAFSVIGFMGPPIGPILGGWIGELGDEGWCDWSTAIMALLVIIALVLFMPETLSSELLKIRAEELRKQTGDDRYETLMERKARNSNKNFGKTLLSAMFNSVMFLVTEPITLCFATYMSVVYIILFGDLESYAIIFSIYDWKAGKIGSVFAAMAIGMAVTGLLIPVMFYRYKGLLSKVSQGGKLPQPEERLKLAIYGTWTMPIGLFWGGWTAYKSISPWSLIISQFVFGFGTLCCFISSYMYVIDVYQVNSASPLASLVFMRYIIAGAGSVMFTRPMFEGIGIHWGMSLLGFLAILVSFVPVIYYLYGPLIRSKSKYAMAQ